MPGEEVHRMTRPGAVLLLAATLAVPARADQLIRQQSELTAPLAGIREVRVENARGSIELSPGTDDRLHVTAIKTARGLDRAEIERFARDTRVEAGVQGGRYVIHVHYPHREELRFGLVDILRGRFDLPRVDMRLVLTLPARMPAALVSTSGDLATRAFEGPQRLESTSGDVRVEGAAGTVDVHTTSGDLDARRTARLLVHSTSGDVTVTQPAGRVDVHSTSGDVTITAAHDSVRAETVSGDMRVEGSPRVLVISTVSGEIVVPGSVRGTAQVTTTSGSVRLGLGREAGDVRVETVSGDLDVRLPAGSGAALDAHTTSGTIDASVPLQIGRATRHALTATVGPGGPALVLRSVSGDIHLIPGGGD
jgi:putative adhesin